MLSVLATVVKMLSGLVINKAMSIYVGPSGLAVIGQFQNFLSIILTLGQGGINSGVVRYTSQYKNSLIDLPKYWSCSLKITSAISIVISFFLVLFSSELSRHVFFSEEYRYLFYVLSATLLLYTVNQLLLSIINGLQEIKLLTAINITQSIISLFITTALIITLGLKGALLALIVNQSLVFCVVILKLRKHKIITMDKFLFPLDFKVIKTLSSYSIMSIATLVLVPAVNIAIRGDITDTLSLKYAGIWQGMTYLSQMYLMVVTSVVSIYLLPKYSELNCGIKIKNEVKRMFSICVPLLLIMFLCIYILRGFIISLVFSNDFLPMMDIIKWYLYGDILKSLSFLFSYIMIAKSLTKTYLLSEIALYATLYYLTKLSLSEFGFAGVGYAYTLTYLMYFLMSFFIFYRYLVLNRE
ncbi:O-antigen translocase [Aeromonas sp. s12]|uniref:O-antigen translocase n=1 Tax=Aeromonas sp. s12 TaxID=3138482 RepID=UPI0034A21E33